MFWRRFRTECEVLLLRYIRSLTLAAARLATAFALAPNESPTQLICRPLLSIIINIITIHNSVLVVLVVVTIFVRSLILLSPHSQTAFQGEAAEMKLERLE